VAEGALLGLHQDRRFKSENEDKTPAVTRLDVLGGDDAQPLHLAEKIASGVIWARELVNAPPNVLDPVTFAEAIQDLAKEYGLECTILEEDECDRRKMGAFLGVAKASDLPAKFVHLIYRPESTARRKLAIVGKGLTFDSGGYNIKVAGSGIEAMKMDMGGAAATFGAAKAIAQLKPDVEVHFISAITENMISGHGLHPGDILTASNGKTIEINNTDAEGRLTLADALVYADQLGAEAIVDLATLTGACVIALGDEIAGMWGDEGVQASLTQAAKIAGEKLWAMPLEERYAEGLKSPIADLKNTGPRGGGAITAALFLKNFAEKTPWVHIDIAGPVWSDKDNGLNGAGGTGFGVRTLVQWVMQ
jgi:leucyl aminopeptidase